ncbi:MAG: hypothetical protein MI975_15370, partial [Cytophagales bacterium]|nr:hypothetical protein [Cytophagales bacterium]
MKNLYVLIVITVLNSCSNMQDVRDEKRTFYVDATNGKDTNSGQSPETPWASLDQVNKTVFKPGDELFFKSGTSYKGQLVLKGSGTSERPISINNYGEGAKPRIDAEGKFQEALLLKNVEFWNVQNLELTNYGPYREENRWGVRVLAEDFGEMKHIRLQYL